MGSHWGRDFPPVQTGPGAHSALKMSTQRDPIEYSLYCTLKMFSIDLKMTVYGRNMLP